MAKPRRISLPAAVRAEELVRENAYYRWKKAGGHNGSDLQHWLEAEKEISKKIERVVQETSKV